MAYAFDFAAVFDYSGLLVQGAAFTLGLTAAGAVLGGLIGIAGGVIRAWRIAPLHWLFKGYVEAIRNTPFLVQLMFVFFGLPSLGLTINEWQACLLTTVVNLGAYITEIVRAGVQSIERGQWEAADSLGLKRWQRMRLIVLPQALRRILPPLAGQFIMLIKTSSIVSLISIQELTFLATEVAVTSGRVFEVWLIVAGLYFVVSAAFSLLFQVLEQRGRIARHA